MKKHRNTVENPAIKEKFAGEKLFEVFVGFRGTFSGRALLAGKIHQSRGPDTILNITEA